MLRPTPAILATLLMCAAPCTAADESGVRRINGTGIYCRIVGQGDPLVVVHGGPGLAHDYLFPTFSKLASTHRVIFYDQRGCGRSDTLGEDETPGMDTLVRDLEGLRQALGLETMTLAGQSWGALVAVNYADRYRNRVNRMLLLEPAPINSAHVVAFVKRLDARHAPADREAMEALHKDPALETKPDQYRKFLNLRFKAYYFDPRKQDPARLNYLDGPVLAKFLRSAGVFSAYMMQYDLSPALQVLDCPTLILRGDADPIPMESAQEMKALAPKAELKVVKDCGHFVHVEREDEYLAAIRAFLKRP